MEPSQDQSITDDPTYQARVKAEIEHYSNIYEDEEGCQTLTQPIPESWQFAEEKAHQLKCAANQGRGAQDEIITHIQTQGGGRILSIGSGPGGQEMEIARKLVGLPYEFICLDLNPQLVEMGQNAADAEGLNMKFEVQDINDIVLSQNDYEVVMCFASFHHLANLEHVFFEINQSLTDSGKLVVVDIVTRNGYLMWDETYDVVRTLWRVLPNKFKYNHTSYSDVQIDMEYENRDYGGDTMECFRSQDIVPLLNEYFHCHVYVPYFSISRRFLDTMYGPNYDLTLELDKSIAEFIWQMDVYFLTQGILKPETMFGVYFKGSEKPRPMKYAGDHKSPSFSSTDETSKIYPVQQFPTAQSLTETELKEFRHLLHTYQVLRRSRLFGVFKSIMRRFL